MKIRKFQWQFKQGTRSFGSIVGIFVILLIAPLTTFAFPVNSSAKEWPNKQITLIVPWSAGAGTDLATRTLAPKLSKILNVPVSVVNKPGAGGIIGTLEAVKSPADGYTLFMDIGGTSSIQYAWAENLPYKVEERTYIALATLTPQSLIVPASSPWKTPEDLVNAVRSNPSGISYGLVGGLGPSDVAVIQFRAAIAAKGVDVSKTRAVSYKGTGETVPAVAGGHISFVCASPSGTLPFISAGKIRPLAVTSAERFKLWPNVPTMAEAGFPSVNMVLWVGLSGPPNLPANIVKILDNAVRESLNDPEIIAKLDKLGIVPFYKSENAYRMFVMKEGEALKALKLK